MLEILLKCEVSDCDFLTPTLPSKFYGVMVDHLKVILGICLCRIKGFPPGASPQLPQ